MLAWVLMVISSLAYPAFATLLIFLITLFLRPTANLAILAFYALAAGALTVILAMLCNQFVPREISARPASSTFRLAHLNALVYSHTNMEARAAFIANSNADIVTLVEVNKELTEVANTLKDKYPYQVADNHDNGMDINLPMLLLSRYPVELLEAPSSRLRLFKVALPSGPIHILQAHTQSPYKPFAMRYRDNQLAALTKMEWPDRTIMVGDINTTPWDTNLQPLRQQLTLVGSWLPTFPAFAPVTPIDLILTKNMPKPTLQRIRVKGTDHLGLVADFSL